jgi:hypothetical protein
MTRERARGEKPRGPAPPSRQRRLLFGQRLRNSRGRIVSRRLGAPHSLMSTHMAELRADLVGFMR